ncbi:hypothetical protein TorRG33x02_227650 [Trema orientale]|uniref:RNase H type-1 domain-containing protein n=1 Tax=Trema orientale TaxID=63057 RepID=A0A2P5E7B2_TREOI|nr:hypothetical protein TorRG33x02_227650 [Trema orientale]
MCMNVYDSSSVNSQSHPSDATTGLKHFHRQLDLGSFPLSVDPPPPLGWVKPNFNTAVRDSQLTISVVARNAFSNILLIKIGKLSLIEPTLGEALAVNMVVDYAIDEGWTCCLFEGDSQVVISELNSFEPISI